MSNISVRWPKVGNLAIVFLALFAFGGCDRSQTVGDGSPIPIFKAPDRLVLAKVNGESVTVRDFKCRYDVEKAIYRRNNGRNKAADQLERSVSVFMGKRAKSILPEIINQRLISQYLSSEKVAVTEESQSEYLKKCLTRMNFKTGGIKAAAAELGVDEKYLEDQLLVPFRLESARNHFGGGPFSVTEEEIDEGLARQDRYYEMAIASNAVTYATCSNVLKMVTAEGLDFKEAGLKFGQYETEDAEKWGRLEYKEIENREMRDWAFKAPVGSIGGPFDLDDGLSIVKILDRNDGTIEDSMASDGVADVTLARITFYLVVPEPEPRTREFVKGALFDWKVEQAQKGLFGKLHEEMKLEYPNGTNFVFAIERKGDSK